MTGIQDHFYFAPADWFRVIANPNAEGVITGTHKFKELSQNFIRVDTAKHQNTFTATSIGDVGSMSLDQLGEFIVEGNYNKLHATISLLLNTPLIVLIPNIECDGKYIQVGGSCNSAYMTVTEYTSGTLKEGQKAYALGFSNVGGIFTYEGEVSEELDLHSRTFSVINYAEENDIEIPPRREIELLDQFIRYLIENDSFENFYESLNLLIGSGTFEWKTINLVQPEMSQTIHGGMTNKLEGIQGNGVNSYLNNNYRLSDSNVRLVKDTGYIGASVSYANVYDENLLLFAYSGSNRYGLAYIFGGYRIRVFNLSQSSFSGTILPVLNGVISYSILPSSKSNVIGFGRQISNISHLPISDYYMDDVIMFSRYLSHSDKNTIAHTAIHLPTTESEAVIKNRIITDALNIVNEGLGLPLIPNY